MYENKTKENKWTIDKHPMFIKRYKGRKAVLASIKAKRNYSTANYDIEII